MGKEIGALALYLSFCAQQRALSAVGPSVTQLLLLLIVFYWYSGIAQVVPMLPLLHHNDAEDRMRFEFSHLGGKVLCLEDNLGRAELSACFGFVVVCMQR